MVTATITNIIRENENFRVFYSLDGRELSQLFPITATKAEVRATIKSQVKAINDAEDYAASLQSFIGTVID